MKIGQEGLDLIKSYEQLRLKAYMPTVNDVPTIGYGHTKGVKIGDVCTEEQALEWLREDCADAEECLRRTVRQPVSQSQYDALCSLVFNIGCFNFVTSTLLKYLNARDYHSAAKQFARWNKQKGIVLNGLTRRREKEAALFTKEMT